MVIEAEQIMVYNQVMAMTPTRTDATPATNAFLEEARAFRAALVEELAFGGWWTRDAALHGRPMPALARQLGVQADALREAGQLYRTGSVAGAPRVSPLVSLDAALPP